MGNMMMMMMTIMDFKTKRPRTGLGLQGAGGGAPRGCCLSGCGENRL
jgi:hypothetical protein